MSLFNEIERILSDNLNLNKARVTCIRLLILALIQARIANLRLLSLHFLNSSQASSSYRHIQRLFKELIIDYKEYVGNSWFKWLDGDDIKFCIIATNDLALIDAAAIYAKRWEIEILFSCFKGRGFRLEETHLADTEKMSKLHVVVSLAFCWAYRVGE